MKRILVVEDDPILLDGIAFVLQKHEFNVSLAKDGIDAMQLLETGDELPDMIVSDISMPNMDGYQLLEMIRSRSSWQTIPFIFLTAHESKQTIRKSKMLGVDDFLTKPFEAADLITTINNKLHRKDIIEDNAAFKLGAVEIEYLNSLTSKLEGSFNNQQCAEQIILAHLNASANNPPSYLLNALQFSTIRTKHLLNQITCFIHTYNGRLKEMLRVQPKKVSLNKILEAIHAELAQDSLFFPDIEIMLDLDNNPCFIQGIERFITAIVVELLINACEVSQPDDVVLMRTCSQRNDIIITIVDQGSVVSSALSITDGNKQISAYHHTRYGSSLALVQTVIQLHGGTIYIDSIPREGTVVEIRFPSYTSIMHNR